MLGSCVSVLLGSDHLQRAPAQVLPSRSYCAKPPALQTDPSRPPLPPLASPSLPLKSRPDS